MFLNLDFINIDPYIMYINVCGIWSKILLQALNESFWAQKLDWPGSYSRQARPGSVISNELQDDHAAAYSKVRDPNLPYNL